MSDNCRATTDCDCHACEVSRSGAGEIRKLQENIVRLEAQNRILKETMAPHLLEAAKYAADVLYQVSIGNYARGIARTALRELTASISRVRGRE